MENSKKVTRKILRSMKDGETREFQLATPNEVESAATNAYLFGRMTGCKYRCSRNYKERTITITKEVS